MDSVVPICSKNHKIHSRIGHVTVRYGNFVIVWGGYEDRRPDGAQPLAFWVACYHPPEELLLYDTECEIWHLVITRGEVPPKLCGSTASVCDDQLFIFGGFSEGGGGNVDTLYQLDLRQMEWRLLHPAGRPPLPCDKLVSWTYDDAVYVFGGFGPWPEQISEYTGVTFTVDVRSGDQRGWNNQLARYRPARRRWEWPRVGGDAPSPRAAHAAALLSSGAFVFGGRMVRRLNDLYRLDLETLQWRRLTPDCAEPQGRSWHSLTPLNDHQLLLYGGFNDIDEPLADPWLLDVVTHRWSRAVGCVPSPAIRMWHTAAVAAPGEVLVVGGLQSSIFALPPAKYAAELVVARDTPRSLLRLCLEVVERHWMELESAVWLLPAHLLDRVHARLKAERPPRLRPP